MQTSNAAFNYRKKLDKVEKPKNPIIQALNGEDPQPPQAGFVPEYLPNFTGNPSQPAINVGSQPTQTNQSQTRSGSQPQPGTIDTEGDFWSQIGATPRYQRMQMNQEMPTPDAELSEKMKRRAKWNLIGKGLSSLAQLGGVAAGGDAVRLDDNVTPWIQNQLLTADDDYRRRMQDWVNKGFQVDLYNNEIANKERSEDYDTKVRADQAAQKAEYDRVLANQKAQADLNKLQTQSKIKQFEEMQKVGVDPNSPDAYGQYLKKMQENYINDQNYTKARTNWNNRLAGGKSSSSSKRVFSDQELSAYQRGRDAMIAEERAKLKNIDQDLDSEGYKAVLNRIKTLESVNPGSNELIDREILMRGGSNPQKGQQNQIPNEFNPEWYLEKNTPKINVKAQESIQSGINRMFSPEFKNMNQAAQGEIYNQIIQGLLESGSAQSEEEAEQYLIEIINNQN